MGKRADTKTLMNKGKKCIVEGVFKVSASFRPFFEEHDMDFEEETIIRREITPSGKTRAFVNDTPVRLDVLRALTSALVDLHQQFDTLDIHNVSFQLNVIDALAGHQAEVTKYRKEYGAYSKHCRQLNQLLSQRAEAAKEMDFLQFQLDELEEADLVAEEDVQAEEELKALSHAEDIQRILGATHQHLSESDAAVVGQLKELLYELANVSKYSQGVASLRERLEGLALELEDVATEMERLAESTEYDPQRIMEIRERLDLVYRLQNKHQVSSVQHLLDLQEEINGRLNGFGDLSGEISRLEGLISKQEALLKKAAAKISKKRRAVIPGFEKKIKQQLTQLSMPHALLKVDMATTSLGPDGTDKVAFLFAANKGSEPEAIKDVASGGELSRLTLCVKSLVAGALALPTMIFDEIDTGVSGDVALKMGGILKALAKGHQILSITHTPQIAVQADRHFFVYKNHSGQQTTTSVTTLTGEERVLEVATMLSGSPPSDSAVRNARELLGV
jgi:DNA repair protein RecN (Recombination protein N)